MAKKKKSKKKASKKSVEKKYELGPLVDELKAAQKQLMRIQKKLDKVLCRRIRYTKF